MSGTSAWVAAVREAADKAYDARPGKPLTAAPEVLDRIRRTLPPPPRGTEEAA